MGYMEENDFTDAPSIAEFYKGKHIFITGGSGFMGKVLIEKLLYSCTDVASIYLLLRDKKGISGHNRLEKLYASECFDRLRNERPGVFESKVFAIGGDITEIDLGLSQEDRELLENKINIVFHAAASIRFDDPLVFSTKMNLTGTRDLIEIAKYMKHLKAFVHVSTSYSNTNRNPVDEVLYPEHASWRDTIDICEKLDEDSIKIMTQKYLGDIPNTYTFTKQLAEHVVSEQRGILPCVITRPSVVVSSVLEPFPGWVENFNGPVGLTIAFGKGLLQTIYSNPDLKIDYVAVDHAIRHFIAVGWLRGIKKLKSTDDVPIFNCATSTVNAMSIGEIIDVGQEVIKKEPLAGMVWAPGRHVTRSKTINYLKILMLHLMPAILIDTILRISGRKPILLKLQRKIYLVNIALSYFYTNQWIFINNKYLKLREIIKKTDCEEFNYFHEEIDQAEFFIQCCRGSKKYLLKEKPEDLPHSRTVYWRFYYLDKFLTYFIKGFIIWKVIQSTYFNNLIDSIITYV